MSLSSKSATEAMPLPLTGGKDVVPLLISRVSSCSDLPAQELEKIVAGIRDRAAVGEQKYASSLQTFNGRPAWVDLWQELLDAIQYAYKERLEGNTRTPAEISAAIELLSSVLAGDLDTPQ